MTFYETIRSDYGADTKKPAHRPLQTKEHYELMTCAHPFLLTPASACWRASRVADACIARVARDRPLRSRSGNLR